MALEQGDNTEARSFVPSGLAEHAGLSRSVQDFYQPIADLNVRQDLPWALDFGTGADLYRLPAYTGERLSASAFMADDVEQKLDAPKIQPPSDSVARPSVIRTKEDEAIWDEMQKPHKLGKHESATHIGLSPEVIADMQKKGQASKLEFFDSKADDALAALQKPPAEQILIAQNVDMQQVISDMPRGGTLLPEPWMVNLSSDVLGALGQMGLSFASEKFNAMLAAIKEVVVKPIEHPYRGHELEKLATIPEHAWDAAYKAFPDIKQIGGLTPQETTRTMKAIIANELTFYGPEDKIQDIISDYGQGNLISGKTIGFAQIAPKGVRDLSEEFDKEVKAGARTSNPLNKLAALDNNELSKALQKPENIPLLVAANISHNVRMFDRHKNEVETNPLTLGFGYNPDHVFAKSDTERKYLLTKKEAEQKGIPYNPALPTQDVLSVSEHAHNIAKWLQKLGG